MKYCQYCESENSDTARFCNSCGRKTAPFPTGQQASVQPSPTTSPMQVGMLIQGRYRLLEQLGQGGFGEVWKAADQNLRGALVAVKRLTLSSLSWEEQREQTQMFEEEAIRGAQLHHAGLPRVRDYFSEASSCYLVMDYIQGQSLEHCFEPGISYSYDEVGNVALELCEILSYLHSQNPPIIFRDLKPANILRRPDGKLFLVDLGIAREFKPGKAKDTALYGSMGYVPPEQLGRAQTDARADIYSLGATLYALLTGDDPSGCPFNLDYGKIGHGRIREYVAKMTHRDREQRPQSVREVQEFFQRMKARPSTFPGSQAPMIAQSSPASPTRMLPRSTTYTFENSVSPSPSQSPKKYVVWSFAEDDEKVVTKLEKYLVRFLQRQGLTNLHNGHPALLGMTRERYWKEYVPQCQFIVPILSADFWSDDRLVETWEKFIYPQAQQSQTRIIPVIANRYLGDTYDFFKYLVKLPRSEQPLSGAKEDLYYQVAEEIIRAYEK